jgi:replication factor C subunit 3/5
MASALAVPMVTDKGKGPVLAAEVPWSEKYRPKTLDEVAAHKDIIDTSMCHLD